MRGLLFLGLLGCIGPPAVDSARSALVACPTPTPNDGIDDTADVQLAANLRCQLAAGVYDIDMAPTPTVGRRRYNMLTVNGGELYGIGPATVLRFRGAAGGQDWRGVEMIGNAPFVHDLAIDTMQLTGTVEQTHAMHSTGPTTAPRVSDVHFEHGYRGLPGGDCVQLVGYSATLITDAQVDHITGDCDRAVLGVHSGVDGLVYEHNTATAGDQAFDGEGTGEGSRDWVIRNNTFSDGPGAQGAFSLQLQLTDNVRITENVFDGRGIVVYSGTGTEIDHNVITRRAASSEAAIYLLKATAAVDLHDNRIERLASAGAGPVIRAVPHGTGSPTDVRIADSTILQRTGGNAIEAMGVDGLTVERVTVAYLGPPAAWFGISALASPTVRADGIELADNVFAGPLLAVARISGSYAGTGTLASARNVSIGPGQGIRCENPAGISGPVTSTGDTMPTGACPMAVVIP